MNYIGQLFEDEKDGGECLEQEFKEFRDVFGECKVEIQNLDEFHAYRNKLRMAGVPIPSKEFADLIIQNFEFKIKLKKPEN